MRKVTYDATHASLIRICSSDRPASVCHLHGTGFAAGNPPTMERTMINFTNITAALVCGRCLRDSAHTPRRPRASRSERTSASRCRGHVGLARQGDPGLHGNVRKILAVHVGQHADPVVPLLHGWPRRSGVARVGCKQVRMPRGVRAYCCLTARLCHDGHRAIAVLDHLDTLVAQPRNIFGLAERPARVVGRSDVDRSAGGELRPVEIT